MKSVKHHSDNTKSHLLFGIIAFICIMGLYSFFNHYRLEDLSPMTDANKPSSDVKNSPVIYAPPPSLSMVIKAEHVHTSPEKLNLGSNNSVAPRDNAPVPSQAINKGIEPHDAEDISILMDLKKLFKDTMINEHTISVSEALRLKFNDSFDDLEAHFSEVEDFIRTQIDDESKVEDLLNFYVKYTEYEMDQTYDPHPLWLETPENPVEAITLNAEKQRYQRDVFGQDVADALWGPQMKTYEYKMKELEILRDDMYGAQVKEQLIADLKKEYFNNADSTGQQNPAMDYDDQFYVKLAIYGNELMNMTDDERNNKIQEFRNEIYPPDQAKRLNLMDKPL